MNRALEYTVDAEGRVSSNGVYREITEHDWQSLPPVVQHSRGKYAEALDAVAQGKIVAVMGGSSRAAWNVRRSLALAAQKRGLAIETRRVQDPEREKGELILVRAEGA